MECPIRRLDRMHQTQYWRRTCRVKISDFFLKNGCFESLCNSLVFGCSARLLQRFTNCKFSNEILPTEFNHRVYIFGFSGLTCWWGWINIRTAATSAQRCIYQYVRESNIHCGVNFSCNFSIRMQQMTNQFYTIFFQRELCNYIYRYSSISRNENLMEYAAEHQLDGVAKNFLGDTMRLIFWTEFLSTVRKARAQLKVVVRIHNIFDFREHLKLCVLFFDYFRRKFARCWWNSGNWDSSKFRRWD